MDLNSLPYRSVSVIDWPTVTMKLVSKKKTKRHKEAAPLYKLQDSMQGEKVAFYTTEITVSLSLVFCHLM